MQTFDMLQWPAFAASLAAAYWVGSNNLHRRKIGFWIFLASNFLWVAWGLHTQAWALITLQICLAVMNVRGLLKTDS
ncbi:MAG: hypothetical protein EOP13_14110 [Pseudomonas sp.]|uniref:hypothetical protein n=1 Tax=Pseudomonas sp. TaxID=306 RepID=UPI00121FAD4A|nr:hypothetical protein [Pseudomonas sp.]RZI72716.1 MAG: hypothetical protein EOP13_14110 [Pseudomonas sp.]